MTEEQAQKEHRSLGAGFSVDIFKRIVGFIGGAPFVWSFRACLENRHIMFEGFVGFEEGT